MQQAWTLRTNEASAPGEAGGGARPAANGASPRPRAGSAHPDWREARQRVLAALAAGIRVIAVLGEPGTGRSRLLRELAENLQGVGTVRLLADDELDPDFVLAGISLIDDADRLSNADLAAIASARKLLCVCTGLPGLGDRLPQHLVDFAVITLARLPACETAIGAALAAAAPAQESTPLRPVAIPANDAWRPAWAAAVALPEWLRRQHPAWLADAARQRIGRAIEWYERLTTSQALRWRGPVTAGVFGFAALAVLGPLLVAGHRDRPATPPGASAAPFALSSASVSVGAGKVAGGAAQHSVLAPSAERLALALPQSSRLSVPAGVSPATVGYGQGLATLRGAAPTEMPWVPSRPVVVASRLDAALPFGGSARLQPHNPAIALPPALAMALQSAIVPPTVASAMAEPFAAASQPAGQPARAATIALRAGDLPAVAAASVARPLPPARASLQSAPVPQSIALAKAQSVPRVTPPADQSARLARMVLPAGGSPALATSPNPGLPAFASASLQAATVPRSIASGTAERFRWISPPADQSGNAASMTLPAGDLPAIAVAIASRQPALAMASLQSTSVPQSVNLAMAELFPWVTPATDQMARLASMAVPAGDLPALAATAMASQRIDRSRQEPALLVATAAPYGAAPRLTVWQPVPAALPMIGSLQQQSSPPQPALQVASEDLRRSVAPPSPQRIDTAGRPLAMLVTTMATTFSWAARPTVMQPLLAALPEVDAPQQQSPPPQPTLQVASIDPLRTATPPLVQHVDGPHQEPALLVATAATDWATRPAATLVFPAALAVVGAPQQQSPAPQPALQVASIDPRRSIAPPSPGETAGPLIPIPALAAPPDEPRPALIASAEPALPRPAAPGLLVIAKASDTLPSLYRRIYQGVTPPPFAVVASLNPERVRPGNVLTFPAPAGGWARERPAPRAFAQQ